MLNPFGEGLKTNACKTEKKGGSFLSELNIISGSNDSSNDCRSTICFAVAVGPSLATETTFM